MGARNTNSLGDELRALTNRYRKQSAELEESRAREALAKRNAEEGVRTELDGLREAVRIAEVARDQAEDGLARAKDKRRRDLQVGGGGGCGEGI